MKPLNAHERHKVREAFGVLLGRGLDVIAEGSRGYLTQSGFPIVTPCEACLYAQTPPTWKQEFCSGADMPGRSRTLPEHCYVCKERDFIIDGVPIQRHPRVEKGDYLLEEGTFE